MYYINYYFTLDKICACGVDTKINKKYNLQRVKILNYNIRQYFKDIMLKIKNFFWNDIYNRKSFKIFFFYSIIMMILFILSLLPFMIPKLSSEDYGSIAMFTHVGLLFIDLIYGLIFFTSIFIENQPKNKEKRLKDTPFITSKFYKIFLIISFLLFVPCFLLSLLTTFVFRENIIYCLIGVISLLCPVNYM